jgi:Mismatch repair ATPase (MutS family)
MEPQQWYQQQVTHYTHALARVQRNLNTMAIGRLACFVLLAMSVWQWIKTDASDWMMASVFSFVVFVVLVRLALRLKDRKALLEKLLFINNNELSVLQHQPNQFPNGQEFATHQDYSTDLDIFGPNSMYHLLNRTATWHGSQQLATLLRQPHVEKSTIEANQQAIEQLSSQKELRQLATAHGLLHEEKEGNLYDILTWLQQPAVLHGRQWVGIARWVLPLYNIGALFFYLATDNYFLLAGGVLVSWLVTGQFMKRINQQHMLLGKKQSMLDQYGSILAQFSKVEPGESALLQQEKQLAREAHVAIKKLSSLAGLFDQRLNMLVSILLNSLFLYDVHCLWALEEWKTKNSNRFNNWIHCVGTIESLNSLATFAFNNPQFHYPTVLADGASVSASQLAHPLIPAHERVANDCSLGMQEKLVLITGSNMSGKTTFLRTLGVNLLLAQCGAPVCAATFSFSPMRICTSIRVSDSLQEHTSYFMAELKRLQEIVHTLMAGERPMLVLIDEILRGTNSEDKTHGSELFIKKLLQYRCLTLFATHDLALSRLEEQLPGQVSNYCFESIIRDGELIFDYKLQAGVAKNRNATFLMKKMEII